jgi:hypothetical protein
MPYGKRRLAIALALSLALLLAPALATAPAPSPSLPCLRADEEPLVLELRAGESAAFELCGLEPLCAYEARLSYPGTVRRGAVATRVSVRERNARMFTRHARARAQSHLAFQLALETPQPPPPARRLLDTERVRVETDAQGKAPGRILLRATFAAISDRADELAERPVRVAIELDSLIGGVLPPSGAQAAILVVVLLPPVAMLFGALLDRALRREREE